ncbi:ribosomal-processing cysteine protease Prp [Mycoplasmatota bacterium WC44]
MIVANFTYGDEFVFEMSGHAEYDESGKDIVCAAASSIAITSLKAIDKFLNKEDYVLIENDGYLKLIVKNNNDEVQLLLENLIETLQELESQFPRYIKIKQ